MNRPCAIYFQAIRLLAALTWLAACGHLAAQVDAPPAPGGPPPYLLHLPGISGARFLDRQMLRGWRDAGFDGQIETYDWTEHDPGMDALLAYARNHKEAKIIAAKLEEHCQKSPQTPIILIGHSGGGALAVWALEDLSDKTQVQTVFLLAPALSPDYDLSKALRHVSGKMYVFSSLTDTIVLGAGTKLFGTMDGIRTDAAGRVGFNRPASADPKLYAKLVPMVYDPQWAQWGDLGDHIGAMSRSFAEHVLFPLVIADPPATQPIASDPKPVPTAAITPPATK